MKLRIPNPIKPEPKILLVGPLPPTVGGITTYIMGMLESELSDRYRLIAFGTERPTLDSVRDVNDYSLIFRLEKARVVRSIVMTAHHLLSFPVVIFREIPALVHIHSAAYWSFWENAAYILIAKLFGRKTVVHLHSGSFFKFFERSSLFSRLAIRMIFSLCDKVIVLSEYWKDKLSYFVPRRKMTVITNFVDTSRYLPYLRDTGIESDVIKVLFFGGVGAIGKGLYDVLKAVRLVARIDRRVIFVLVACKNVKLDYISLDIMKQTHVQLLDYVYGDEKTRIFREADIFILPSYSEGLPITLLEAMGAGLPVIATQVGAIPEIVEDGKNGFLVPIGEYSTLAEKILILARDKELRMQMCANNLRRIREKYEMTSVIRKIDMLYADVLDD